MCHSWNSSSEIAKTSGGIDCPHQPSLSKKAMRRLLKSDLLEARKVERRRRRKALKKVKAKRAEPRDGVSPEDHLQTDEFDQKPKRRRLSALYHATVVIDLGFDDKMSDKVRI